MILSFSVGVDLMLEIRLSVLFVLVYMTHAGEHEVDTFALLREEGFVEKINELLLGDCLEGVDVFLLLVKVVRVRGNLVPVSLEVFIQVGVFL